MRRRAVRLIAAKELLDTLRDRRTLFVSLVLPLLLYPTLLLGLTQIIGATQRDLAADRQRIVVDGDGTNGELSELLAERQLQPVEADALDAGLRVRLRTEMDRLRGDEADDARVRLRTELERHDFAGAVLFADDFGTRIRGARQAEATLLFNPTDEASKTARGKVEQALEDFETRKREELFERFPDEEERLLFAQDPVRLERLELASPSQKGAYSFAPLLGMLIVIMALTGAFYPAVDLGAGEKERGTLETLLVAPVTRREIVLGKFLAVWVIAVVTALSNLLVMGLTFSKLAGMIGSEQIAFHLPLLTVGAVTLILIPTAALFSAIALALSSFATSYKEGQYYMSPLYLVAMPLAMVALLPNIELGYTLALVPVANVVLLVKAMLLGGGAAGPAAVATGAMALYAAFALWVAVGIFRRESVLFRTGAGKGFDAVTLRATRAGLPAEGLGFLIFFVVLALMFFLSGKVESASDAVRAFLVTQLLGVLAPTLLLAYRAKLNVRETFSLRGFRPLVAPLVMIAAASTLVVVIGLYSQLLDKPSQRTGIEQIVEQLLGGIPPWLFFCMLAVLPPLCEEILCRGFLLSAFRTRYGAGKAIIFSALLFGALHLDLYRFPGTFVAGLMLGYVCVRTRSIFASMLFHMTYNGIIAASTFTPWLAERVQGIGTAAVGLAGVLLIASIALLQRATRRN